MLAWQRELDPNDPVEKWLLDDHTEKVARAQEALDAMRLRETYPLLIHPTLFYCSDMYGNSYTQYSDGSAHFSFSGDVQIFNVDLPTLRIIPYYVAKGSE